MTSIGTGYDLSASTYSPDGRIFQVEYANKAVEHSGTTIGLKLKDAVILAVEKPLHSPLLVSKSSLRIQQVDLHVGLATAGLLADGRHLANRARDEAESYLDQYGSHIPTSFLAGRLGSYCQAYTLYSSVRPFGVSSMLAGVDADGTPGLYCIEPSGVYWGFRACAIGKGTTLARTEIEKLKLETMSISEAVDEAARIIYQIHDDAKDKAFELEMSWCSLTETKGRCVPVPQELVEAAEVKAKAALDAEMED